MGTVQKVASAILLTVSLLLLYPSESSATTKVNKNKSSRRSRPLTRAEIKQAEDRLSQMGYKTGKVDGIVDGGTRQALMIFQKWEDRKVTGSMPDPGS